MTEWTNEKGQKMRTGHGKDELTASPVERGVMCEWARAMDGHFNISCVEETGERGNYDFKGRNAKWEFKHCPYCGREIKEIST